MMHFHGADHVTRPRSMSDGLRQKHYPLVGPVQFISSAPAADPGGSWEGLNAPPPSTNPDNHQSFLISPAKVCRQPTSSTRCISTVRPRSSGELDDPRPESSRRVDTSQTQDLNPSVVDITAAKVPSRFHQEQQ